MKSLAAGVLVSSLCVSCASEDMVTDGDRQISWQNYEAAMLVSGAISLALGVSGIPETAASALSAVAPAARDIVENSKQQIKNWGGEKRIKDPQPYSPEASRKARGQSEEEHKVSPFWAGVLSVGGVILGLLTGRGVGPVPGLMALAPRVFGGPVGLAASTLVEGIARIREKIQSGQASEMLKEKEGGGTEIDEDKFLKVFSDLTDQAGIRGFVKNLAHKVEARMNLKL